MKANYFLKQTIIAVIALFGFTSVYAEDVKTPNFVWVENIVTGENGLEPLTFLFEAAIGWGDYNNDGYLDLLEAGVLLVPKENEDGNNWVPTTYLYKNNGDGTFTKVPTSLPNLKDGSITWLDYDNDGNLDVFLTGRDDVSQVSGMFRNTGAPNFEFEEVFSGEFKFIDSDGGNKTHHYVAAADYDNDGWVDIFMSGRAADPDNIYTALYKNIQGVMFQEIAKPVNGTDNFILVRSGGAHFADFDGDGYLDLAVAGWTASELNDVRFKPCTGAVYKNNGDGTFGSPWLFPGGESGDVVWNDFDNDGKLDFSVTGYCHGSAENGDAWQGIGWQGDLFVNNGDGTFERNDYNVTHISLSQEGENDWGDVNNDGFADMLYPRAHNDAIFLNNFGDKSFTKMEFVFGEGEEAYKIDSQAACALVDFNRDGNLDACVVGYGGNPLRNYIVKNNLGEGIPANAAPSVPANLIYAENEDGITFSWDAATDDHTPSLAIQYNLFVEKTDGSIYCFAPANIETGYLKINDHLTLINGTSYTLKGWTLEDGDKYGVQAVDNAKLAGKFNIKTVGSNSLSSAVQDNINVSVNGKSVTVKTNAKGNVSIYSVSGLNIAQSEVNAPVELTTGIYLIKVVTDNGSLVKKVIIK